MFIRGLVSDVAADGGPAHNKDIGPRMTVAEEQNYMPTMQFFSVTPDTTSLNKSD